VDLSKIKNQKNLEIEIKDKFTKISKVLDVKIVDISNIKAPKKRTYIFFFLVK
jgi:hypothetical protein